MSVKLRKKSLASGKISLYLDIYHNGKRNYEFLNITYNSKDSNVKKNSIILAESIRAKRELELIHHDHGFIPSFKKKANYVDYFKKLVQSKPPTEKAWKNTLNYLERFTSSYIQFLGVTEEWLESFKTYLLTKVSQSTAHTYFSKIKASLRQATKDKILISNPAQNVDQIPRKDKQRTYLELHEIETLLKAHCMNQEVKRAFLFACFTGLRISDIKSLEWGNINGSKMELSQKKTNDSLYLPLSQTALSILNDKRKNVIPLPITKVFDLPSDPHIWKVVNKWYKEAKLEKKISFHTSRHTFATMSLTLGVDLYTVSKLLGHTDIKHTQIYAKIIDQKKVEAIQKLPKMEVG